MPNTLYETEIFTPSEMLAVTGLAERRYQSWVQRGFMPQANRPGPGVPRKHSICDLMFLTYVRVLSDAGIPLEQAAVHAYDLFHPASLRRAPSKRIVEVFQAVTCQDPPRFFAVINGRQSIVSREEVAEASAPLPAGKEWGLVVDLTSVIIRTFTAAKQILACRGTPAN